MQPTPLKGDNGNYIYFPNDAETVVKADKFSTTFLGLNVENKEKVHCKLINPETLKISIEKLNLFLEAGKLLKHESFINTLDVIVQDTTIIVIQETFEHYTLKDLIINKQLQVGKYDVFFIKCIIQVLIGLEFLHQNKVCHLNISPENILIPHYYQGKPNFENPEVKIGGTELLKLCNTSMPSDWGDLKTANILYSSPEFVLKNEKLIGLHSDIYSMGLVLYETVAKKHLMDGHTNRFFINRMQYSTPVRNIHKIEDYMFAIIQKACIKVEFKKSARYYTDPQIKEVLQLGIDNRFTSAKEFGLTLIKYMEENNYQM